MTSQVPYARIASLSQNELDNLPVATPIINRSKENDELTPLIPSDNQSNLMNRESNHNIVSTSIQTRTANALQTNNTIISQTNENISTQSPTRANQIQVPRRNQSQARESPYIYFTEGESRNFINQHQSQQQRQNNQDDSSCCDDGILECVLISIFEVLNAIIANAGN